MVNTKRGRFTSPFWRSLGVFLLSVPLDTNAQVETVEISNGVPAGTVGSYRVDVETDGGTRTVFVDRATSCARRTTPTRSWGAPGVVAAAAIAGSS